MLVTMTTTAEQISNPQAQLEQSRQHTAQLVTNLESVRNEASGAVTELRRQIADLSHQQASGSRDADNPDRINLLSMRTLEPKVFSGGREEN